MNVISIGRGTLKLICIAHLHFAMLGMFWGAYSWRAFNMKENY
jgi:hypothetical protein